MQWKIVLVPSTGFSYLNLIETAKDTGLMLFSSPPRGSLISIHENLTAELPGSSSRPLHGVHLSQFKPILFIWQTRWMFSSPPRGSLISICAPAPDLRLQTCSRPLHGVLLSQWLSALLVTPAPQVLVPSTGFSYLNNGKDGYSVLVSSFSSPPRGSLISILSLTPPKTQGFHPPFAGQTRK